MEPVVLRTELFPGVIQLLINRPSALNALNGEVLGQLSAELEQARADAKSGKARVLILRGAGEKAFVAGADIAVLKDSSGEGASSAKAEEFIRAGVRLMEVIETHPLPILACVDGFCLGGGLELALSCDLIFCSDRSKFGLPEITLGVIPGFGGTQRLSRRVGIGLSRRMIMTGDMLTAKEAEAIGLVDRVAENARLTETVLKFAALLTERSALALEAAKCALKAADGSGREHGFREEERLFLGLLKTADAREGLSAFVEKRKPEFKGR